MTDTCPECLDGKCYECRDAVCRCRIDTVAICPECLVGKCRNCDGDALDVHTDEFTKCRCSHEGLGA